MSAPVHDSICLSLFLFDTECYACGMTRAIQHLIHFDFLTGYNYNKLSIIVFFKNNFSLIQTGIALEKDLNPLGASDK